MTTKLRYGTTFQDVTLPEGIDWTVVEPKPVSIRRDLPAAFLEVLRSPTASSPLVDVARGKKRPVILLSSKARRTLSDRYLPMIVGELERAGVAVDDIVVLLATGTHEAVTPAESEAIVGRGLAGRMRVEGHDPRDEAGLVRVGRTSWGNEIRLSRRFMDSDLKILTGRITHHYFAGFSGGRKAIFPGVAEYGAICRNHRRVLEDAMSHPPGERRCRPGHLEGNPVHEEMMEIGEMIGPEFILNTVMDGEGNLLDVVAGNWREAHGRGCDVVRDIFERPLQGKFDIVIASAGGTPFDLNFIQMMKTVMNNAALVKDGGVFIVVGQCQKGIHPGYHRWGVAGRSLPEIGNEILDTYDLPGHNLYLLAELSRRISLIVVSGIPVPEVASLGLIPAVSLQEAVDRTCQGGVEQGCIIHFGNITFCPYSIQARKNDTLYV